MAIPNTYRSNTGTIIFKRMDTMNRISIEGFTAENGYCDILSGSGPQATSIGPKSLGTGIWDMSELTYNVGDILAIRIHADVVENNDKSVIIVYERHNGVDKIAGMRLLDKSYSRNPEDKLDIPFITGHNQGAHYIVKLMNTRDVGLGDLVTMTIDGQSGLPINTLHNNYIGGVVNSLSFINMIKPANRTFFTTETCVNDGNIPVIFNSIGYNRKPNDDGTQCTITSPRRIKWLPAIEFKLFTQIPNMDKYEYRFAAIGNVTKQLTEPLEPGWKTVTLSNTQELDNSTLKVTTKRKILPGSKVIVNAAFGYEYMNSDDKLSRVNLNYNSGGNTIRAVSRNTDETESEINDFPYGGSLTVYFAYDRKTLDNTLANRLYINQSASHDDEVSLRMGIQCIDADNGSVIATKSKNEWELVAKKTGISSGEHNDYTYVVYYIAKMTIQPIGKRFKLKIIH